MKYDLFQDYPGHFEELHQVRDQYNLSEDWANLVQEEIFEIEEDGDIRWGTKLGGWPAPIQNPIEEPLTLQLGCENDVGLQWVDSGCVYLWRKPQDNSWDLEIEFY